MAYTFEQMESIQTYFLEPGYSLFIEWGWNTSNGYGSLLKTSSSNTNKIVKSISQRALNWNDLTETRLSSFGQYDCFLGFIVGGNVSSDGDSFNIQVKIKGTPSLPTYLQSYRNTKKISEDNGRFITSTNKVNELFSIDQLTSNNTSPSIRMFRYMFNELPSDKQLVKVRDLQSYATINKFVNFDKSVEKIIQSYVNYRDFLYGIGDSEEVKVGKKKAEILKEDLFSKNKYIRMDLAVDILNTLGQNNVFEVGGKEVSFRIDINDVVIGAFPYMFSTDESKLLIPGEVPDFYNYFIQSKTILQNQDGSLVIDGETKKPINPNTELTSFVELTNPLSSNGYKEQAKYYGYLKHLFVNFDLFKSKLDKKIVNIREVFVDLLNGMSSAVNAFWKFEIVEGEDSDGNIIITVIDENWIGEFPDNPEFTEFQHNGLGSVFLSANLDISLPSSMVGQIVSSRLGYSVNPDAPILQTNSSSFFSADTDLFFTTTDLNSKSKPETPALSGDEELAKIQERFKNYISVTDNYGIKNVKNRETGEIIAVIDPKGTITPKQNEEGRQYKKDKQKERELIRQKDDRGVANIQSYIQKLDVVPKSTVSEHLGLTLDFEELQSREQFDRSFSIFCFNDADFFDIIKNGALRNKYPNTTLPSGYSTLIPIKYEFTILGNSGIRRGDVFKIKGIPEKYSKYGIFQVTEISHTLEGNTWKTTVGSLFRQIQ